MWVYFSHVVKQRGNACLCICEQEEGIEKGNKGFNPMGYFLSFILEKLFMIHVL